MKKFLSIILAILMIVTSVPFAFAAGDGVPLTIDVTDKSYVDIGNGYDYYDEDGYIITGTNQAAVVWIYEPADLTLRDAVFAYLSTSNAPENSVINITFEGTTEVYHVDLYKEHLIFDGDEAATIRTKYLYTNGNSGSVTVNGGNIILNGDAEDSFPTIACDRFIINGGTVSAFNNYYYVVFSVVTLNGGELNIISTSADREAIDSAVTMKKGTLLTVSAASGILSDWYGTEIVMADGAEENDYFFVRYDKESNFVPVRDIEATLDGKNYAEIKIDTHEHSLDNNGNCICGYECPHESYTECVCDTCGYECPHESYTECVCDTCGYECPHEKYTMGICDECNYLCPHSFTVFNETVAPKCEETGWEESNCDYCNIRLEQEIPATDHEWVSGGVERPSQNIDGSWSDGYYYDSCKNDGTHINITGIAKRADYSAYDEAYKVLKADQKNANLTDAGAAAVNQAVMTGMTMPQNIVEDESTAAYLNNWVKNAQNILAKIESGEYVKADYTEIDEAIKVIDEAVENAAISEEMAAELANIKADIEALKKNENATMADVIELNERLEAIAEIMAACAKGVHSFTTYEEVEAPKCDVAGKEAAICDNGCGETDEREIPATGHKEHEDCSYGNMEHWKDCVYGCGTEIEGTRELHTYTWEVITEATETTAGEEKGTCACGWYDIREIPATGETPDEPTDDTCDHICHSNNALMKIFWKIANFFFRLFDLQQYCDCGEVHYDDPIMG